MSERFATRELRQIKYLLIAVIVVVALVLMVRHSNAVHAQLHRDYCRAAGYAACQADR